MKFQTIRKLQVKIINDYPFFQNKKLFLLVLKCNGLAFVVMTNQNSFFYECLMKTFQPIPTGARIDVSINDGYDGSYSGSPHELITQPTNLGTSKTAPTRRTSVTNILVCRPKRTKPSLSEFLEQDENELEGQRPYITGHNR